MGPREIVRYLQTAKAAYDRDLIFLAHREGGALLRGLIDSDKTDNHARSAAREALVELDRAVGSPDARRAGQEATWATSLAVVDQVAQSGSYERFVSDVAAEGAATPAA